MARRNKIIGWVLALGVISIALVGIATAAVPRVKEWWKPPEPPAPEPSVRPIAGRTNTFEIPEDVARTLGLDKKNATSEVHEASHPRPLDLSGTLALDTNHLVRIHSRFAGEVVKIGEIEAPDEHQPDKRERRPIRFGDRVKGPVYDKSGTLVKPGDLLAEVWSKDLGEKKSELVSALSQLRVDQETLSRMRKYADVIPERNLREQEAKVADDRNRVSTAERTLRVWRISDQEISDVEKEAEEIFKKTQAALRVDKESPVVAPKDPGKFKEWGKVEVRAPFDGTVLEKNLAVGDIVDTSTDLYKIADLRHLSIWAHAYEEDLPKLLALKKAQRRWAINVITPDSGAHQLPGTITQIGEIIDPNQHTALVMGHVDNPKGYLRAGQFVSAVVNLPPDPTEVEVPTAALIENGAESTVLIQPNPGRYEYQLRKVAVARRTADYVCLRTKLTENERKRGLTALRSGDHVVTVAVLELIAAFKEQEESGKKPSKE